MEKTIIASVIGNHPIRQSIIEQLQSKGRPMETFEDFDDLNDASGYGEFFVLPNYDISDESTLQAVNTLALKYPMTDAELSKPVCHLLLHSQVSLWLLQTLDLYREIHRKFEIYAFTLEDQWAKNVFCQPNSHIKTYPHLDREKIDYQSNKTVHLVIYGFSEMSESLAFHAALTAHFPNFIRDHSLRTRITILAEDLTEERNAFIQRYKNLFDHSYYRTVNLNEQRITQFHEPIYSSSREDFVDVEWEFVDGSIHHPVMQQKLALWAEDKDQLLTIALCDISYQRNFNIAFAMPKAVYENHIPVLVHVKHSSLLDEVKETDNYHDLFPFGMEDFGYDITLPLLQMAKRLNYLYTCSFGQKGMPTDMPTEEVEKEWRKIESFNMRYSSFYNVMTLATKMRSLGHDDNNWNVLYALTQDEIEMISAVEHNRWNVERLLQGFRPPTDKEREEIEKNIQEFIMAKKTGGEKPERDLKNAYKKQKVHYDICAYRELKEDKTGQNVKVYDYDLTAGIPLIAQSFNESR